MAVIGKVDHISITVKDMKETEAFYRDVLGFETTLKLEGLDCPDYSDVMGAEGVVLNAMIMTGHGIAIEFLEFVKAGGETLDIMPNKTGASHLCFETDNANDLFEKIKGTGAKFVSSRSVKISSGPHKDNTVWYFKDPNGYLIEFLEYKK